MAADRIADRPAQPRPGVDVESREHDRQGFAIDAADKVFVADGAADQAGQTLDELFGPGLAEPGHQTGDLVHPDQEQTALAARDPAGFEQGGQIGIECGPIGQLGRGIDRIHDPIDPERLQRRG